MNCITAQELSLKITLKEDIPEQEFQAFDLHIVSCETCRTIHEKNLSLHALIEKSVPSLSDTAAERALERLSREFKVKVQPFRLRRPLLALAATLLLACSAYVFYSLQKDEKCPCWRYVGYDPGNTRNIPLSGQPGELIWRQPLHAAGGFAKPLAWHGIVVVNISGSINAPSHLAGFESSTGRLIWKTPYEEKAFNRDKNFSDRLIQKGRLYVANGKKCLCYDAATGQLIRQIDPPQGTDGWSFITSDNQGIIGASGDGKTVFKIFPSSGKTGWIKRLDGSAYQPALHGKRMYCHTDKGTLLALDTRTGKTEWNLNSTNRSARSQLHVNRDWGVLVTDRDEVVIFSPEKGRLLWNKSVAGSYAGGLALGGDTLYLEGGLAAVALKTGGSLRREAQDTLGRCAPPVLAGSRMVEAFKLVPAFQSCEGVILADRRFFAISQGYLLAFNTLDKKS